MSQGTRNLLIVVGIILVIACCCCIVPLVATGGAILGMAGELIGLVQEGPYQVNTRPMPASDSADVLLPPTVGSFTREEVAGAPDDGGALAVYRSGRAEVRLEVEVYATTADAQAAVDRLADQYENRSGSRSRSHINESSFLWYHTGSEGRMAWNRGATFFDVQTDGLANLDSFMNAYPY